MKKCKRCNRELKHPDITVCGECITSEVEAEITKKIKLDFRSGRKRRSEIKMNLNKVTAKSNMYNFVTHTWNVFKGKCGYNCSYCYMKKWGKQKPLRFDENELKSDLGSGNKIFVGSSTDMFHPDNSSEQVQRILDHCKKFDNEYLFQTKNPARFNDFDFVFPKKSIFCVTIESDIDYKLCTAPKVYERYKGIKDSNIENLMITIEPIMKFNLSAFVILLKSLTPLKQINIGADSGNNNLPEPSKEEVLQLIEELEKFTKVVQKKNLRRLLK